MTRRVRNTPLAPPRRRLSRVHVLAAGGIVLAAAFVGAVWSWRMSTQAARLPAPATTDRAAPAVAEHLRSAYTAARGAPSSPDAVGALCTAYHADMFFEPARQCYIRASELDAGRWRWDYGRALIETELGGGAVTTDLLRRIAGRAPDFAPVWLRLGDAEFKAGRYAAAEEAWTHAAGLAPPPDDQASPPHRTEIPLAAYASFGLARIALGRNEPAAAVTRLEVVIAEAPGFGPAFRLLADAYRALGREDEAARAVYRAGRRSAYAPFVDPVVDMLARESRSSTLLLRAASEVGLPINAELSEYFTRRALQFDPANPEVVLKLARVLRTTGRDAEALPWFLKYHAMVPADYQGLAHIGSCLSALGRYAEAESYFTRALAGLDDPVTHYNMGLLMAVTGRLDAAVAEYRRALERDPMYGDARGNLAAALVRQGNLDEAGRELLGLVKQDPDNAIAHANLGLLLLQQGRRRDAAAELSEALRLDPRLSPAANALATLGPRP